MMRTVTVSPNFAFLIIGTRIGLVGKRKVYSEALICRRHVSSQFKKKETKTKTKHHQNSQTKKPTVEIQEIAGRDASLQPYSSL